MTETQEGRPGANGTAQLPTGNTPSLSMAAAELHAHGMTVIPVRTDGTKAPALKAWQQHTTTAEDLHAWFGGPQPAHTAMGVVTGPRSGNLEMVEIEGPYAHEVPGLAALAHASGLGDLWDALNRGWMEESPSGGLHWFYRVAGDPIPGNTKLAQDEPHMVDGKKTVPTIAETRGTGGQTVIAPTNGTAHATGRPWVRLAGGPASCPTLTPEERAAVHGVLATLDRRPAPQEHTSSTGSTQQAPQQQAAPLAGTLAQLEQAWTRPSRQPIEGLTPGDDFEARTTWEQILEPAGWRKDSVSGGTTYWIRPGKTDPGVSATTGHSGDRDRLYVFSSSTPFPAEEPITKFGAYAVLNHGGNHGTAAGALRAAGYGAPLPVRPTTRPAASVQAGSDTTALGADSEYTSLEDSPLAELAARALRGTYRWAGDIGWRRFNGRAWVETTDPNFVEAVHKFLRRLHREGTKNADADRARKLTVLLRTSKIRAVASLLTGLLEVDPLAFDTHPDLLNVRNGTVDLTTGTLRPHNPDDMLTKTAGADYIPGATHPDWTAVLAALPPEQHEWMQLRVGQASTGYPPPDDKTVFHQGSGSNGKSAALLAWRAALGDHAAMVPEKILLAGPGEHPTELTTLQGVRLAIIEELPDNAKVNIKRLKDTVGTPEMTARRIRQDSITWKATHTLFISTNPKPRFPDTDWATWRRLVMVTYPYTYLAPGAKLLSPNDRHGDTGLRDRMSADPKVREAVLAWIVAGAARWYAAGKNMPPEPAAVAATTAEWRGSSDHLGEWLRERVELDPAYVVISTELFQDFNEWLKDHGNTPWSDQLFTERLQTHPLITGADVIKRRGRSTALMPLVSRRNSFAATPPSFLTVWTGLKFRG